MQLLQRAFEIVRPKSPTRRRKCRPTARRMLFESLEDRRVMATFPFTIINNSTINADGDLAFQDSQIYLTLYSKDFASAVGPPGTLDTWYSYDASGTPTATPSSSTITGFALNSLTQTGPHTYVINLPDSLPTTTTWGTYGPNSMRAYVSMGAPLTLNTNGDGSVNGPLPGNDFYDYFELSLSTPGNPTDNLNIDTTNVDQFGIPISIMVDSTAPGVGIAESRESVIKQFQDFLSGPTDPYAVCIWPTSDPTYGPYRILNPSHVLDESQSVSGTVFAQTALNAGITASQTTFNVGCGASFPATPFFVEVTQKLANTMVISEIMQVTSATALTNGSSNWTVLRGQQSTTPQAFNGGALINMAPGSAAMSASQTTLTVGNTTGFPTALPFDVLVESEIMQVTGYAVTNANGTHTNYDGSTTWNVTRGVSGSTAAAHDEGVLIHYYAANGLALNTWYNTAIDDLFAYFANPATPAADREIVIGGDTYTGTVTQDASAYVLRFNKTADLTNYDIYYPFFEDNRYFWAGYTPAYAPTAAPTWMAGADVSTMSPSQMVFECNGVFADNTFRTTMSATEQSTMATLENKVVSALNRGVATLSTSLWETPNYYYGAPANTSGQPWNHYAQFLHESTVSIGGLNYGFAFDDQAGQASDIGVASFTSVTITLGPWGEYDPTPGPLLRITKRDFFASFIEANYPQFIPPPPPSPVVVEPPRLTAALVAASEQVEPAAAIATPSPVASSAAALPPKAIDAAPLIRQATESEHAHAVAAVVSEIATQVEEPIAVVQAAVPALDVASLRGSLLGSRRRR